MPSRGGDEPLLNGGEPSDAASPDGDARKPSLVERLKKRVSRDQSVVSVDVEMNSMKGGQQEEQQTAGEVIGGLADSWYRSIIYHDYLPGLKYLKKYPSHFGEWFFYDCIAGFSVAVMLIPMVLAYALLAFGNPPQLANGLYSAFMGVFVYSLLGGSRVATVGPVALISLLIFAQIGTLEYPTNPGRLPELASAMGWYVGVFSLIIVCSLGGSLAPNVPTMVAHDYTLGSAECTKSDSKNVLSSLQEFF